MTKRLICEDGVYRELTDEEMDMLDCAFVPMDEGDAAFLDRLEEQVRLLEDEVERLAEAEAKA